MSSLPLTKQRRNHTSLEDTALSSSRLHSDDIDDPNDADFNPNEIKHSSTAMEESINTDEHTMINNFVPGASDSEKFNFNSATISESDINDSESLNKNVDSESCKNN